jgi:hypothetical protein
MQAKPTAHPRLVRLALLTAALSVSACVLHTGAADHVEYAATNAPPRPLRPRSTASVKVFVVSAPQRAYTEVGVISTHATGNDAM